MVLASVILLLVGFGAGHFTASSKNAPLAASTVTPTVLATPTPSATESTGAVVPLSGPTAGAANASATPSQTTAASATATSGAGGESNAATGTVLGTYTFDLPYDHPAPIGQAAPTLAEIASGANADLTFEGSVFEVTQGDEIRNLANGTAPTYQSCVAATKGGFAGVSAGTEFCIAEASGRMAGVSLSAVDGGPARSSLYAVLQVTLWQGLS